jgi:hypothetical protein
VEAFAWGMLGLVFLDELLALAALGVWGWEVGSPRWLLILVFGLASWALWDAGHEGAAVALLVFSVVVNGVARSPAIAEVGRQT